MLLRKVNSLGFGQNAADLDMQWFKAFIGSGSAR